MTNKKYIVMFTLALMIGVLGFAGSAKNANAAQFTLFAGPNLTIGSHGQNVVELQGLLSELGYLDIPISIPYGYFGSMTRSALARYQAASGITPAQGYFGPLTRAQMQSSLAAKGWLVLLY